MSPSGNEPVTFRFVAQYLNPLKNKLIPICHLLALLGAHHILYVSGIRVNHCDNHGTPFCPVYSLQFNFAKNLAC